MKQRNIKPGMQLKDAAICCIFNYAPHYRAEIYLKMENDLQCRFYFGNSVASKIEKMDYSLFKVPPRELKYITLFSHFNWLLGAFSLVFKPYKVYVVTGEPYCLSTWAILVMNKLLGKKTYLWSHGWYGKESKVKSFLKKQFFNLSNGVLLYGHYAEGLMLEEGINKSKLKVVYNSLHYSKQKGFRKKLKKTDVYKSHFLNESPTVVFIGRVEERKKLNQILEALLIAKEEKYTLFNICIIGGGSDLSRIQELVRKLDLVCDVWFYGACYEEERISELIYNADLCVSPGEVGLTAIHSLSYGTPVLTHNDFSNQGPEFEAVQEGETGIFFEKNNVFSLLKAIERWFKKHPYKTKEISGKCYQIVDEKYNPQKQLKILKEVIESPTN